MGWSRLLLLILSFCFFEDIRGDGGKEGNDKAFGTIATRKLSAASTRSELERKSQSLITPFKHETVFHYLHDANDAANAPIYAASLSVKSKDPILVLEDLETELRSIVCSASQISLFFNSLAHFDTIKEAFQSIDKFIIVTSHDGCNGDGEREAYRANKAVIDAVNYTVSVDVVPCQWKEAFVDTHVFLSQKHPSKNQMRRRTIEKRQDISAAASTTMVQTGAVTPTVSFPTVPSATSGLPSVATKEIDFNLINQVIYPPQVPVIDSQLPQGITVSCKNCSLRGTVEISEASFNLPDDDDNFIASAIDTVNDTIEFFKNGAVEVVTTGLFAIIELELDVSASQDLASVNLSLHNIPLTPFEIPGVATFGPMIVPEIDAVITLSESLSFTYGMNMSVPDNSTIAINMTELADSFVTGFDKTTVHALPFQATAGLVSLLMSLTFKPQVLLGISTFTGKVTGGIGGFLVLPTLAVNISQLANVDGDCNPLNSSITDTDLSSIADNVKGNFTNVVPTMDLGFGALAKFELDVATFQKTVATEVAIASTSLTLPTTCLEFDSSKKTYGSPNRTAMGTDGSGSGTSVARHNGGEMTRHSDSAGLRRIAAVAALLVSAGFGGFA